VTPFIFSIFFNWILSGLKRTPLEFSIFIAGSKLEYRFFTEDDNPFIADNIITRAPATMATTEIEIQVIQLIILFFFFEKRYRNAIENEKSKLFF
tara:strand:+ start:4384 stop:4668 length:285 start_codon:yes stop_codon:yes gene_type:complete